MSTAINWRIKYEFWTNYMSEFKDKVLKVDNYVFLTITGLIIWNILVHLKVYEVY